MHHAPTSPDFLSLFGSTYRAVEQISYLSNKTGAFVKRETKTERKLKGGHIATDCRGVGQTPVDKSIPVMWLTYDKSNASN